MNINAPWHPYNYIFFLRAPRGKETRDSLYPRGDVNRIERAPYLGKIPRGLLEKKKKTSRASNPKRAELEYIHLRAFAGYLPTGGEKEGRNRVAGLN